MKPSFLESLVAEPTVKVAADQKFEEIRRLAGSKKSSDRIKAMHKIAALSNADYEVMDARQINFIDKLATDTAALDGATQDGTDTQIGNADAGTSDTDQQGDLQGEAEDDADTDGDLLDGDDGDEDDGFEGELGDDTSEPDAASKSDDTDAPDGVDSVEEVIVDAMKHAALLEGIEEYFQETVGSIQKKASLRLQTKVAMQKKIASIRKQYGDDIAKAVVKIASANGLFE